MRRAVTTSRSAARFRPARVALVGIVAGATVALFATPAGAEVSGGCAGRAAFQSGTSARGPFTVDPALLGSSEVIEVPITDTVAWEGAVTVLAPPGSPIDAASLGQVAVAPRAVSGHVVVDLPWPLGQVVVGDWDGQSARIADAGEERYELPSLLPRGVVFKVSAEHRENGAAFCSGSVLAKVEGGPFDSPILPATLALTAISAALLMLTGVAGGSGAGSTGPVQP